MTDLTIIIPARNEEFLGKTIEDILEHIEADTKVIAVLDGYLPNPPLPTSDRVTVIYNPVSVGQRAGSNQAARIADSKYLMKVDAHCAFDQGFDVKMLELYKQVGNDVTMIPIMRNLHAFDWICKNGHRRYQSPSGPCETCGEPTTKDVVWIAKPSPQSTSFRFDKTMHFQYFGEYKKTEEYRSDMVKGWTQSMSIQGSCFMCTKDKWFELDICSEEFNSWGQQGVEVACKTWLSGGRVLCNQNTWYAHMFRTRGGDFGFPYSNPQSKVNENRELSREMFMKDKWSGAKLKFQWLLDKFNAPDWADTKGMIYYTPGDLDPKIAEPVRNNLQKIATEKKINITCSSLKKMDFGTRQVYFPSMKKGYLAMFKQILGALEKSSDEMVFFTEHDVLYHPSHFDFKPERKDTFYYNRNVWNLRIEDGHSMHYDVDQLSGLCVYRDVAITHFRERFELAEQKYKELVMGDDLTEFNRWVRHCGFEPFTHNRIEWKNKFKCETWMSEYPNVDIKYGGNSTPARWNKDQYRNQNLLINWTESEDYNIPGWNRDELIALK